MWSAATTSREGKVGVAACLPVKGILFSFMASAWQWLNFRGSLWSCGPFLFLVLMFGFGWFRDLQIGHYLFFKLLPSNPTTNGGPKGFLETPILFHISSSLPSQSVTATPTNLMLEMFPLLCSVPLVQVTAGLTWNREGPKLHDLLVY